MIARLDAEIVVVPVLDGDEFALGKLRFRLDRTDHYVQTHAVRVDAADGTSFAYSADTGPDWSIERLGRGIDLALIEATYGTDEEAAGIKHLSAGQAGEMAQAAGVKRLVLTHTWPGSPVQQSPQRVQVKRRPSRYHNSLTSRPS